MKNKPNYELETVPCCCCGSSESSIFIKEAKELYIGMHDKFDIVRCTNCGLIYTNPRPTIETIGHFYPDSANYYNMSLSDPSSLLFKNERLLDIIANHFNYPFPSKRSKIITNLLNKYYKNKILMNHIPPFVKHGKLLDIGCSWGAYLYKMQDLGWDVYGIETNEKAVDFAKKKLGLKNIFCGSIHEVELKKDYFNVIRMGMVLEHMHNPVEIIKTLSLLIKPNGLLVLNVPNVSGLEMKIFGRNAYFLHVPQHLYHFTPISIKNILKKGNFKTTTIIHHQKNNDWIESAINADIKILTKLLENRTIDRIVNLILLEFLLKYTAFMGKTSRMTVYAEKI
ncbi:type 12 methyltransferase [Candidatus Magnetomorum sp. HK-1]|nr:type 12 methyltransferase [Candidatus Magnetomorum sp. HK-1]